MSRTTPALNQHAAVAAMESHMRKVMNAVAAVVDLECDLIVALGAVAAAKASNVLTAATAAVVEITDALDDSQLGTAIKRYRAIQSEVAAAAAPYREGAVAAMVPLKASVDALSAKWREVTGESANKSGTDDRAAA